MADVSVVIPSRNYGHYVGAAIKSALNQESVDTEVIVVDDGSADDTAEVAAGFPSVLYVRQGHRGVGAARNAGVRRASCDAVAFLDADDIWKPDKLRVQLEALTADESRHVIYGHVQEFLSDDVGSEGDQLKVRPEPYAAPIPSTMLIPRKVLAEVGDFREDRDSGEALDWTLRLRERGFNIFAVADVVTLRRVHANNSGRITREAQHREYLEAVKRSLDRRRQTGGAPE